LVRGRSGRFAGKCVQSAPSDSEPGATGELVDSDDPRRHRV
jgi:hypothetical protein